MKTENENGNADSRTVNAVEERLDLPMMSDAGKANASHAGQQVDWKNGGDLRGPKNS
jgi:hypothetical protein